MRKYQKKFSFFNILAIVLLLISCSSNSNYKTRTSSNFEYKPSKDTSNKKIFFGYSIDSLPSSCKLLLKDEKKEVTIHTYSGDCGTKSFKYVEYKVEDTGEILEISFFADLPKSKDRIHSEFFGLQSGVSSALASSATHRELYKYLVWVCEHPDGNRKVGFRNKCNHDIIERLSVYFSIKENESKTMLRIQIKTFENYFRNKELEEEVNNQV